MCGLPNEPLIGIGCGGRQDREEATLELSLLAEAFHEMLAQGYGELILNALYAERCAGVPTT